MNDTKILGFDAVGSHSLELRGKSVLKIKKEIEWVFSKQDNCRATASTKGFLVWTIWTMVIKKNSYASKNMLTDKKTVRLSKK